MKIMQFPEIIIMRPLIPLIQAWVWFVKSYKILPKTSLNGVAIISAIIFTYLYAFWYSLDFNMYQLFMSGLANGLVSIGFYKASRWLLSSKNNNNG